MLLPPSAPISQSQRNSCVSPPFSTVSVTPSLSCLTSMTRVFQRTAAPGIFRKWRRIALRQFVLRHVQIERIGGVLRRQHRHAGRRQDVSVDGAELVILLENAGDLQFVEQSEPVQHLHGRRVINDRARPLDDVGFAFQHQHRNAGARHLQRGDQPDRPSTRDDDAVETLAHAVPQTSRAVSTIRLSLANCSSMVSRLPSAVEAKPHCGDRQS